MSTASLKLGTLLVRVERGRELGGAGKSSSILSSKSRLDPFVAVSLTSSDEQRSTPAVGGGKFPSWEHCPPLKFHLDANARSSLHIDVYDQRTMGGDKKLGRAIVNFAPLLSGAKSEIHEWFPLMSEKSGESKGEVRVKIEFQHEQRKHDTVVINFGSQPPIAAQTHSAPPAQTLQQQPYAGMSPPQQFQQPIMYYHPTGTQQPLSPTGQMHSIQPQIHNMYPPPPAAQPQYQQQQQQPVQFVMQANTGGYAQLQQHHYPPNVILPNGAAAAVMVPQQQQQHQVFASSAPYPPMMTTMPITMHPQQQQQQQPLDPNLYPPPPPIHQQQPQYGTLNQQQVYQVYPPAQQQSQATSTVYPAQVPGQQQHQQQHQHGYYTQ